MGGGEGGIFDALDEKKNILNWSSTTIDYQKIVCFPHFSFNTRNCQTDVKKLEPEVPALGDRKSGIPAFVEIPAPHIITIFLNSPPPKKSDFRGEKISVWIKSK